MSSSWLSVWKELCLNKKCEVLSSLPQGIIAICKPCGVLSHPNENISTSSSSSGTSANAIIKGVYNYKSEVFTTSIPEVKREHLSTVLSNSQCFHTHLLHRLDKGTSGVMLVSVNASSAKMLKDMFRKRLVKKEYYAVVYGVRVLGGKQEMWWEDAYQKIRNGNSTVRASFEKQRSTTSSSLVARTKVFIEHENRERGLSLLRLQPHTGYSHQLRYQCALHHSPILGDDVYGNFTYNKDNKINRLCLHSHKIEFSYAVKEQPHLEMIKAVAPIPPQFLELVARR